MFFEQEENGYFLLALLDTGNESERLVLSNQMGTEHCGTYKETYFPVDSVGIFVIISVLSLT